MPLWSRLIYITFGGCFPGIAGESETPEGRLILQIKGTRRRFMAMQNEINWMSIDGGQTAQFDVFCRNAPELYPVSLYS